MGWEKGQSGNPGGRPRKGRTLSELMERIGAERDQVARPDGLAPVAMTKRERLVRELYGRALAGELAAIRLVLEYLVGKPGIKKDPLGALGTPPPYTADEFRQAQLDVDEFLEEIERAEDDE